MEGSVISELKPKQEPESQKAEPTTISDAPEVSIVGPEAAASGIVTMPIEESVGGDATEQMIAEDYIARLALHME